MYDLNSAVIAAVLFVSMVLAIEIGYRLGSRAKIRENELSRAHVGAIQGSLLGILALLLGFTFSLSLQRFDNRSAAAVDEANAIGTAFLRAQMLPVSVRADALDGIRDYVDLRVTSATSVTMDDHDGRAELIAAAALAHDRLWTLARQAAEEASTPITGLFVASLNELIDAFGTRNAALDRHVPELVLFLLYGTFLMAGAIVGYAAGIGGHRASLVAYIMVALIVLLVFIIIDLDRPRRGLIEVNQQSLIDLQAAIAAAVDGDGAAR